MIIDSDPVVLQKADKVARTRLVSGAGGRRAGRRTGNSPPCPRLAVQRMEQGIKTPCVWTAKAMETLQRLVGPGVHLVFQFHMDLLCLPPGLPHAVTNLQRNVKFTMDGALLSDFPLMVRSMREIRPYMAGHDIPYDYSGGAFRMSNLLVQSFYNGSWRV